MKIPHFYINLILLSCLLVNLSCTGGGPPEPGQEISFPEHGVTLRLTEGWEGEVVSADWSMWERIQKGRADEPWVFPPVTVTKIGDEGYKPEDREFTWRFKGVAGAFDPTVNPTVSGDTIPPGLWALDPQKLELVYQNSRNLEWPGINGIEAIIRLYENTHGAGPTQSLWHTYTVTFGLGENTYEFVMQIPYGDSNQEMIAGFWGSIEDVVIEVE